MGSFANTLFTILLGWLQTAVSAVWSAFHTENGGSFFTWIGEHWILIAGILCAIGLTVDLCVYILRWKPFRVWQSFFSRNARRHREEREEKMNAPVYGRYEEARDETRIRTDRPERYRTAGTPEKEEADLSAWESQKEYERPEKTETTEIPSVVTNAGYIVPADSPYRRPSGYTPAESKTLQEPDGEAEAEGREERDTPQLMKTKKRRRISVSELFADPEEELREFEAPQQIIDSRRAYHDPVYPRGWKKSEDNSK